MMDSFQYLPRLISTFYQYQANQLPEPDATPFVALTKPLSACKIGVVSTAGLYQKGVDEGFDLGRERAHPEWGDPSWRTIPAEIKQADLGVSHLHYNTEGVSAEMDILLPLNRLRELADAGKIGAVADRHASLMGYQGFPPDTTGWQTQAGPEIAAHFLQQKVDGVLLVPS